MVYRPNAVDFKTSPSVKSGEQLETNHPSKCELISSKFFHYMQIFAAGQQVQWVHKQFLKIKYLLLHAQYNCVKYSRRSVKFDIQNIKYSCNI